MQISDYVSKKIYRLSFIFSIFIVFIHCSSTWFGVPAHMQGDQPESVQHAIYILIYNVIGALGVPFFFAVSGFLMFTKFKGTFSYYKKILIKKAKTLLCPYLFWSFIGTIFVLVVYNSPLLKNFSDAASAGLTHEISFWNFFCGICFFRFHVPMWFMFQLLLFSVYSIIIYSVIKDKKRGLFFLLVLLVFHTFRDSCFYVPFAPEGYAPLFNPSALFYYSIGGFLAIHSLGVRSQESGVRSQESGVRSQESGVRSQEFFVCNLLGNDIPAREVVHRIRQFLLRFSGEIFGFRFYLTRGHRRLAAL